MSKSKLVEELKEYKLNLVKRWDRSLEIIDQFIIDNYKSIFINLATEMEAATIIPIYTDKEQELMDLINNEFPELPSITTKNLEFFLYNYGDYTNGVVTLSHETAYEFDGKFVFNVDLTKLGDVNMGII